MKNSIKQIVACISILMMIVSTSALAQDVKKQKTRKAQLEKEIRLLDEQIAGIKEQSASATTRLELLKQNIDNRKALIAESESLIKTYNDSISNKDQQIVNLQNEVDTLVFYYGKLVRNAYKYRDPKVWYLYVFASENLGQAFRRAAYFRNISEQVRTDAAVIRRKKADVEEEKGALEKLKSEAMSIKESYVRELNDLRNDEKEAANLVVQLQKDSKQIERQIADKKKEVADLNREIQRKIEAAQKSKKKSSGSKSKTPIPVNDKLSAEFEANKGKLPWPASGAIVAKFGKRFHPVHRNLELPANEGVDIAVTQGETVKSVFEGTVLDIFVMPSYGKCVMVQHGNTYFTFYCRVENIVVKKGDKVSAGQRLGTVGVINGTSNLHFEIWRDKTPQNPANWLKSK